MNTVHFQDLVLKNSDEVLALLSASSKGLPNEAAKNRLLEVGANVIVGNETRWQDVLLRQFKSAFIYLLLAASGIAIFLHEYLDAGIIFLFLVINAALGFFQEYRAENALKLLKSFVERKTRARRDGKEVIIPIAEVVPGDIIILDAGDMIPADGYFLRAESVTVDESPMTGESKPVKKQSGPLAIKPEGFYGADNIGFSRTTLLSGDAELLVFATGVNTEVGEITEAMQKAESPSAFEDGINHFSKFILKLVLATVPLVFVLHTLVQGQQVGIGDFLLFSIALTVSAIPEALPLVTTISLSRGALLLAKKHVVPRRLSAIEDLGSIDVLCTDKTGTITENKLSVSLVWGERDGVMRYALMSPLSLPDANSAQNSVFDKALIAGAEEVYKKELAQLSRIDELPFDPIRRRGTVLVEYQKEMLMVMRGAPEVVFAACKGRIKKEVHEWAEEQGRRGSRVLAIAYKPILDGKLHQIKETNEKGLTFVGMVAFSDPLKASTKDAIAHAEKLGVHIKIITGDSKEVAGWVGYEAGILRSPLDVISGEELEKLSPEEKLLAVEKYNVFARTMPLQKYEIIELLQKKHLVGFLGEGFNDAPALKMAHVGLAVQGASDIAQDASDIILLNPSLEVIVDGIREGRTIFANSMKYIRATLTSNFGNFYALAFASLFVPYLPMLPIQILLLNLLSDFPMISIATDTVDDDDLKRPRGYNVGELTAVAVVLGVVSTLFDFAFFGYFMHHEEKVLQTMWFIGSILTELILLFSIRTALPFWKAKRPSGVVIWLSLFVAILTVVIPFIPALQQIFGFVTPTPGNLGIAFFLVLFYFAASETVKLLFYRFWHAKDSHHAGIS
jgi:Mg2+-importing ATPase